MDKWPGAYPASEPPTPAPETPGTQQQEPQYPVQHATRNPQPLTKQPGIADTTAHSTQQPTHAPTQSSTASITNTAQSLTQQATRTAQNLGGHTAQQTAQPEITGTTTRSTQQPTHAPTQSWTASITNTAQSLTQQAALTAQNLTHTAQQTAQQYLGTGSKPEDGTTHSSVQPTQLPTDNRLATGSKAPDAVAHPAVDSALGNGNAGTKSHTNPSAGLSNAEYQRLRGGQEERPHAVPEAVSGQTYAGAGGEPSFPKQLEERNKDNTQQGQSGSAGWPLSNVSPSQPHHDEEQQLRKVHSYQPEGAQQVVREVQGQKHGDLPQQSRSVQQQTRDASSASHDNARDVPAQQRYDQIPASYQQSVSREAPQQRHTDEQQPRSTHQYHPEGSQQVVREVQQAAHSSSHDQTRDVPKNYDQTSQSNQQQSREVPQQQHGLRHESRELSEQPRHASRQSSGTEQQTSRSTPSAAGSQEQKKSSPPAYWGALPTAATGGIYNTVTGHGSGREDHDQHHSNLGQKERSSERPPADSKIPGVATGIPAGGVYNTVTGHGSGNDEHNKHHEPTGRSAEDATASRMPLLGAGQSRHDHDSNKHDTRYDGPFGPFNATSASGPFHRDEHQHSTTGSTGPHLGSGSAVNENVARSSSTPSHTQDAQAHPAGRSSYGEAGTNRAFPLTSSADKDGRHDDKSHSRTEQGLAAGALAGTGVAAAEHYGKHDKRDIATATHGQSPVATEQRGTQSHPASHHTHTEKSSAHDTGKPKEHHGLFGLGGKSHSEEGRDSRDIVPISGTHPNTEHRDIQSHHQTQAISPPNQELKKDHHGLFGSHNEEGRDPRDIAPIPGTHPSAERRAVEQTPLSAEHRAVQEQRHSTEPKRSFDGTDKHRAESPKTKSGGVFGMFHRHKDEKTVEEPKHEHRRSDSIERRKLQKEPPAAVGRASNDRATYDDRTQQGHKGLATGAGLAAGGLAASELAHRHHDSQDATRQSNVTETGAHGTGNEGSGPYRVLPSGTASGVGSGVVGDSRHSGSPSSGAGLTGAGGNTASSSLYDDTPSSRHDGHSTDKSAAAAGLATGAGAAGAYAASRGTRDSEPYDNTRTSTGQSRSDSWRSSLPPTVATHRVSDSPVANDTTQTAHSATSHNTGYTGTSATTAGSNAGTREGEHGPHSSRTANALDPRVDADRDGSRSGGNNYQGLSGVAENRHSATTGGSNVGTREGEHGPHSSRTANALDPRVESDRDGSRSAGNNNQGLSGVAENRHSAGHSGTTGEYNALSSGTASGLAAGGAAAAGTQTSHTSTSGIGSHGANDTTVPLAHRQKEHQGGGSSSLPELYNVLPSGTPSGVNIDYRRVSRELEHKQ